MPRAEGEEGGAASGEAGRQGPGVQGGVLHGLKSGTAGDRRGSATRSTTAPADDLPVFPLEPGHQRGGVSPLGNGVGEENPIPEDGSSALRFDLHVGVDVDRDQIRGNIELDRTKGFPDRYENQPSEQGRCRVVWVG